MNYDENCDACRYECNDFALKFQPSDEQLPGQYWGPAKELAPPDTVSGTIVFSMLPVRRP